LRRRRTGGFTMIEMMMVVAVVSILVAIAIYAFSKPLCKAKSSEIMAMFSELKQKEDTYIAEAGRYLCTDPSCDETVLWPTPLPGRGGAMAATPTPAPWQQLKINPVKSQLYCQYGVVAGLAGAAPTGVKGQMLYPTPATGHWYYLIAQCDWDSNPASTANAWYYQRGDSYEMGYENACR
jgi:prepilin-type N-terminal cleavage/methylation domain-containing protein